MGMEGLHMHAPQQSRAYVWVDYARARKVKDARVLINLDNPSHLVLIVVVFMVILDPAIRAACI